MKRLLALALAIMMALSLSACGEKTPAPSGGGTTDPGTSQQTEEPSNTPDHSEQPDNENADDNHSGSLELDNTYADEQLSYIDSLGKTVDGEKLVCYSEDDYVEPTINVYIVEWNASENKSSSIINYTFYTVDDTYAFNRDMTKNMVHYVEHSDDIMMLCIDLSDTLGEQADACTSFEQIAADVLAHATILK